MKQFRHGDVFIKEVAALPQGAVQAARDHGDVILAYGEVTGHAHRIKEATVTLWNVGEQRYLTVERPSDLTHEEHHTITLPPGTYEVVQQREYSDERVTRAVAD